MRPISDEEVEKFRFELRSTLQGLIGANYLLDCQIHALETGEIPENYPEYAPQEAFSQLFSLICSHTSEICSYADGIINYYSEKFAKTQKTRYSFRISSK